MLASSAPSKFPIPFANGAGAGFIRTIPQASQISITPGAASLVDGFPPLNFLPVASGGVPPFGQDMNGVLNEATAALQWFQAGGAPTYDSAFSTAIGGYPNGAILRRTDGAGFWQSTVDNNTSNPDTGGANWTLIGISAASQQQNTYCISSASGAADVLTAAYTPGITALTNGMTLYVRAAYANATTTPTLNVNGLGAKTIYKGNGLALAAGDIAGAGYWIEVQYDTTLSGWVLLNPATGVAGLATTAQAQGMTDATHLLTPALLAAALQGSNQSLAANGYQKLPGGLIIQWGYVVATSGGTAATYPIAFPSKVVSLSLGNQGSTNGNTWTSGEIVANNKTGFTAYGNTDTKQASYIAIGY